MGVKIGDKHSFRDWGLLLVDFQIPQPDIKTNSIDVPGVDGNLDLTEVLTGFIPYTNRTLTLSFIMQDKNIISWRDTYSKIANYCHGREMKITFDNNKKHYYVGRINVQSSKEDQMHSRFTLSANVDPYKYDIISSVDDWLWNPFDFELDIIREYHNLEVKQHLELLIIGSQLPLVPTITSSSDMILEVDNERYPITKGSHKYYDIVLANQEYTFNFYGNGTISVDIRGGSL